MAFSSWRYFPWKLFRHYVFIHLFFVLIALVITGFSIRYFAYTTFINSDDVLRSIGRFDRFLTRLFWVVFIVSGLFAAVAAHYYFRPLGRLIGRARELRKSGADTDIVLDADVDQEDPGEWFDLERALSRIHRDLRIQAKARAREGEELSALISAVSDAILAVDTSGKPLFFNSQFALLFGVEGTLKQSLSLGEIFRAPAILDAFSAVLKDGKAKTANVTVHTSRHALPRHFSISIAPLHNENAAGVYGAVGIFHDVTELKQAEQIRIEFVANASHELRTPLTSIKGYVETLKGDYQSGSTEGAAKFLDIITRNVDRLILLVNDLLEISTLESGAELKKAEVDTREITEAVLRQLEGRRASKRLKITTRYSAEKVKADAHRLEQVLVNLVHNAIKYIPEDKEIEIIWEKSSSGSILLKVRDNGPGVPPEHQDRLFERFYRLDTGRSREQGGTGLGLSIVKHVMLKHGGNVKLKSAIGKGSEFICEFPP